MLLLRSHIHAIYPPHAVQARVYEAQKALHSHSPPCLRSTAAPQPRPTPSPTTSPHPSFLHTTSANQLQATNHTKLSPQNNHAMHCTALHYIASFPATQVKPPQSMQSSAPSLAATTSYPLGLARTLKWRVSADKWSDIGDALFLQSLQHGRKGKELGGRLWRGDVWALGVGGLGGSFWGEGRGVVRFECVRSACGWDRGWAWLVPVAPVEVERGGCELPSRRHCYARHC